jgi:HEAT repeat protein
MAVQARLLEQLIQTRNNAAEQAIAIALANCSPEEQGQLVDVLLKRNRRAGWVALIRHFDRLDDANRGKLVARPRDLFGPLAESMQDSAGSARENVIKIVQHCSDPRLVYLLAEALMDNRHEVRELAGKSLLETVRRYCDRSESPGGGGQDWPADAAEQIRRAVDLALGRFRTHRQTAALHAALIYERQLDSSTWSLFHDTYDELTRAATITFRALPEPALAHSLLLALGTPLKPAAMAGLAGLESAKLALPVVAESFRLVDPVLRDAAQSVSHLKMIAALRKEMPWNGPAWPAWLRLIENVGIQPVERFAWLARMFEKIPATPETVAWRMTVIRALADTMLPEAGGVIAAAVHDADERVARYAARFLLTRRVSDWRDLAAANLPSSPHLSVRRLSTRPAEASGGARATPARDMPAAPRGFDKAWHEYQNMPPAVQLNTARSVANDPAFAEQLRLKLQPIGTPQDITQGLKMLMALPSLLAYRSQIIALCGHRDARIAALAIRLIGRLEDPRLRDLLEAATRHADARVRANAVESMEDLQIAGQSQQVLAMLNSRHNRERANAIKAIGQFNFATARECLGKMLNDSNPLHRLSALWVVNQLEFINVMRQVGVMARKDPNMRVRKRAAEMLTTLSGHLQSLS